jgi:hypothetical protein
VYVQFVVAISFNWQLHGRHDFLINEQLDPESSSTLKGRSNCTSGTNGNWSFVAFWQTYNFWSTVIEYLDFGFDVEAFFGHFGCNG